MYRGPFGIEKLDHLSDRWSVAARADRAGPYKFVCNKFFIDNISINNLVQCAMYMCTPESAMRRSEGVMLNMSLKALCTRISA